jgi:hypothetical protein
VDFAIELTFWEAEQVDEWDAKRPNIEPDSRNVRALDIVHPVLERQKVRSIVVAEIVELFYRNGEGSWGVQIGVNEYKPPPKANATGTPKGSSNAGNKDGPGAAAKPKSAKTAQEEEIERLLAEARRPI